MADPIEVRPGGAEDAEAVRLLYHAGSGRSLDAKRLVDYFASLPCAVAHANGDLVGFGFCIPFAPDVAELGNLFVDSAWRGQGVGAELVTLIEKQAASKFHSILVVNSMLYKGVPGKRPAAAFYTRLGYQRVWSTGPTDVFAKALTQTARSETAL
jgi:GNAT superfamily N-acetyltransferase